MKRLLCLFLICVTLAAQSSQQALLFSQKISAIETIAYDTSTDGGLVNPGTSLTWSHTVTGTHPILWVGVFGDTVAGDATCAKITGVTYNSVSLTQVPTNSPVQTPGDRCAYLFYLAGPATGAHNVVVSASSSIVIAALASSYTGVKQTGIPDSSNKNTVTGSTTGITTSTTVVTNNSWIVLYGKATTAPSAGTGSTQRQTANDAGLYDTNAAVSSGSQSMQITTGGVNANIGVIMASFAPYGS